MCNSRNNWKYRTYVQCGGGNFLDGNCTFSVKRIIDKEYTDNNLKNKIDKVIPNGTYTITPIIDGFISDGNRELLGYITLPFVLTGKTIKITKAMANVRMLNKYIQASAYVNGGINLLSFSSRVTASNCGYGFNFSFWRGSGWSNTTNNSCISFQFINLTFTVS